MDDRAVSLASLGLPGEAYPRAAALAQVDALEQTKVYVDGIDVYIRAADGSVRVGYDGWVYEDREGYGVTDNLVWGSEAAREFIRDFRHDTGGEPLFHLLTRTADSPTAPYDPPRRPTR